MRQKNNDYYLGLMYCVRNDIENAYFYQKFLRRLKTPAFRPGQVWEGMQTLFPNF